jgi:hypothetical protein
LTLLHQSLVAPTGSVLAAPVAAAPPLAAALAAALDAADVVVELVELLPQAVSTSATALTPAIIAVNLFAGL